MPRHTSAIRPRAERPRQEGFARAREKARRESRLARKVQSRTVKVGAIR